MSGRRRGAVPARVRLALAFHPGFPSAAEVVDAAGYPLRAEGLAEAGFALPRECAVWLLSDEVYQRLVDRERVLRRAAATCAAFPEKFPPELCAEIAGVFR